MSILVRFGILSAGVSLFDYGCGQGDDIRALAAGGIEATGWDPHFAPDNERISADVVNLGFVINVIEHPLERRAALQSAWSLTRKVLAVSAMVVGQASVDGLQPYGDGYLTSRGTFQKYYQHAELRQTIAHAIGCDPIAAAPGIFLAFRNEEDCEDFLLARRSVRRMPTASFRSERIRARAAPVQPGLDDRIRQEMEAIAAFILQRGRTPHIDELGRSTLEQLAAERVSIARAVDFSISQLVSPEDLEAAQARRREDLVVHRALSLLNHSRATPSSSIVRDIRALFGSQGELADQAKVYLFGLADAAKMQRSVDEAAAAKLGLIDHRGRFIFDAQALNELPGSLRCYAGCATHLSGEPVQDFLYRLDPARRRVSLLLLDDPRVPLPTLSREVHIDLKRQNVSIVPRRRRLLRKADLHDLGAKSKQRLAEEDHCKRFGLDPEAIFQSLD